MYSLTFRVRVMFP